REEKEYLVMITHEHYAFSGNAAGGNRDDNAVFGEIHGGMTPEEYLVPVVILKRHVPLMALDYTLKSHIAFRDKETTMVEIQFNQEVSTLEATAGSVKGICTRTSSKEWLVYFSGLDTHEYAL